MPGGPKADGKGKKQRLLPWGGEPAGASVGSDGGGSASAGKHPLPSSAPKPKKKKASTGAHRLNLPTGRRSALLPKGACAYPCS